MLKFSEELELAKEIVQKGGEIVLSYYNGLINSSEEINYKFKGPKDVVTKADTESEAKMVAMIREKFPEHSISAEEGSNKEGTTTKWLIDSLDGSDNLIAGLPWLSTAAAVEKDGEIFCGAVYNPITKELYWADRGKGAYLNGQRLQPKTKRDYPDIFVATEFTKKWPDRKIQGLKFFNFFQNNALRTFNFDSMPLDLCKIATGSIDLFVGNAGWPWDYAAGALIVEEAGGIVTTAVGTKLDIYNEFAGIVAAMNPEIHAKALKDLKQFMPFK